MKYNFENGNGKDLSLKYLLRINSLPCLPFATRLQCSLTYLNNLILSYREIDVFFHHKIPSLYFLKSGVNTFFLSGRFV